MYYYHPFLGGFFNFIIFLVILFVIWRLFSLLLWKGGHMHMHRKYWEDDSSSAYELLRERFVKGEIDERDFEYKMGVLERSEQRLRNNKH